MQGNVALGGGGIKGLVPIGVLACLQEAEIVVLIPAGYLAAQETLPEIRKALARQSMLCRVRQQWSARINRESAKTNSVQVAKLPPTGGSETP